MPDYTAKLINIKAFAFDVDGVFTDGSLFTAPDGDLLRTYCAKDGYGVRTALAAGFPIAIITGGFSESICLRFNNLGVKDVYINCKDKLPVFLRFCEKYHLSPREVAFGGDDLPDIPVMRACGLPVCPKDAVQEVKETAAYVSPCGGGRNFVRDVIEQVLRSQDKWYRH